MGAVFCDTCAAQLAMISDFPSDSHFHMATFWVFFFNVADDESQLGK